MPPASDQTWVRARHFNWDRSACPTQAATLSRAVASGAGGVSRGTACSFRRGLTGGPFHAEHGWPCRGSARHPPTTARTAVFHVKRGRRGGQAGGGSSRFLRVGRLTRGSIGLPGPAAGYPAAGGRGAGGGDRRGRGSGVGDAA